MKILLFGKDGQVGWELQRSLAPLGKVVALDHDSTDYCADFSNLTGLVDTIRNVKPKLIVNAAAHTAVDQAQSEPDLVRTINTTAPGVLAQEAALLGSWLVHYSPAYVFDGSGSRPWTESDLPAPLNVYGQTKLEGEQLIQAANPKHLIFRTSWVYAARGIDPTGAENQMFRVGGLNELLAFELGLAVDIERRRQIGFSPGTRATAVKYISGAVVHQPGAKECCFLCQYP